MEHRMYQTVIFNWKKVFFREQGEHLLLGLPLPWEFVLKVKILMILAIRSTECIKIDANNASLSHNPLFQTLKYLASNSISEFEDNAQTPKVYFT